MVSIKTEMKKACILLFLITAVLPLARAQTAEVTQLILNLEKLRQLRKILNELKSGYTILFKGYSTIRDLSKGNFKLHESYLDGLLQVSPSVKKYYRVKDILESQAAMLKEYRQAYHRFAIAGKFTDQELVYIHKVYAQLISQSGRDLDALLTVLTVKKLRASDQERLSTIDRIYEQMSDKLTFMRHFNSNTSLLAAQRSAEQNDVDMMRQLFDVTP